MSRETLRELASKAGRSRGIKFVLDVVLSRNPAKLRAIEVGTMFKLDEGLSTWLIADALRAYGRDSHLWSFELDQTHVESGQQIFADHDAELTQDGYLEWVRGASLDKMPIVLNALADKNEKINFAFLDGNGNPEYNIAEFELVLPHMAEDGIILFDDFVYLKPTVAYPYRRPYGKPQTLLTMLLLKHSFDVLGIPVDGSCSTSVRSWEPLSEFLQALRASEPLARVLRKFADLDWVIIQNTMIAVGRKHMVDALKAADPAKQLPTETLQIRIA